MLKRLWKFLTATRIKVVYGDYTFNCILSEILDGDTIKVDLPKAAQKVWPLKESIALRLAGVDAPELKQKFGKESREFLKWVVKQAGRLVYRVKCLDKYQRPVGILFGQGSEDLNQQLVRYGSAHHYEQFSNGYAADQEHAKKKKKGMWGSGKHTRPDIWRKMNK
jgi:micrococcal nuclease